MVVVHSYRPHWPDELELSPGDVILVLSKHEEERWFGRLQGGQRGYFPASCVMELSQVGLVPEWAQRCCSMTGRCCCSCVMSEDRLYFLFSSVLLFQNNAGFLKKWASWNWRQGLVLLSPRRNSSCGNACINVTGGRFMTLSGLVLFSQKAKKEKKKKKSRSSTERFCWVALWEM